jgi:cell division protein FtsB
MTRRGLTLLLLAILAPVLFATWTGDAVAAERVGVAVADGVIGVQPTFWRP